MEFFVWQDRFGASWVIPRRARRVVDEASRTQTPGGREFGEGSDTPVRDSNMILPHATYSLSPSARRPPWHRPSSSSQLALLLQASALLLHGDADVAAAFCASRLPAVQSRVAGGGRDGDGNGSAAAELAGKAGGSLGWNYGAMACDVGGTTRAARLIERLVLPQTAVAAPQAQWQ